MKQWPFSKVIYFINFMNFTLFSNKIHKNVTARQQNIAITKHLLNRISII